MEQQQYPIRANSQVNVYEFVSVGNRGHISKRIEYYPLDESKLFFNLSFVDVDSVTGEISDRAVSNNGDSQKVLATVAATTIDFTDRYPDAVVYATGSTPARTRLYRMGIANNLQDIESYFEVYGLKNEAWEFFKIGIDYEAFIIKRKQ